MTTIFTQQLLVLHYISPLSWHKIQRLLNVLGDLDELMNRSAYDIAHCLNIKQEKALYLMTHYRKMRDMSMTAYYEQHKIHAIPYDDEWYPSALKTIYDPPAVLYVKGNKDLLKASKKIAVIGSRAATSYSEEALKLVIPPLLNEQFVIVSGLAKGADRFAHEATILYGGKTIGVLGHGLFHLYPKQNQQLAEQMAIDHLLVTEYPPYVGVQKWHFPARNRIISGLSQGLIVTEASLKSGTLITTELALEQGKDVFVIPGNIFSEQSRGPNKLIKEGAIPVWDGYQILEELQMFSSFR
ncbi:DNA-protecting protein DprA [Lysinibacillus sp. 2017]|uniref:DNA-processing protein DprA n=1 Tax=unclassified Lysinibacillus TaxID=2636778 RepID=UPI000D527644|nr:MULTISPECIES: DNA-processing protein DprA [unclassified Lysinibacillus]AWE06662.1 DNA-protecting protein DprA [Lysinibacillus sp. 2017]TGN37406.1 DNA-protecting protein DprA [Lysinibacillus sp. S2017]